MELTRPATAAWRDDPAAYWAALESATAHLDPPFAVLSLPALSHNAFDMLGRANGTRIRVASKSVRARGVMDAVLRVPGYRGVLAYTLAEGLWLATEALAAGSTPDVVVGYPSADRWAIGALANDPRLASTVTLMVDSLDQLDLIDAVVSPARRQAMRLCLELDASWDSRLLGHVGTWRSPVHSPEQARALAEAIARRPGFRLVGMMAYEGQLAGVADAPAGKPARAAMLRWMKRRSAAELAERRAAAVAAVRHVADLEFVNGGGTGSLETTSAEQAVTEIAAGSGLFGPHLFDGYRSFRPAPAAALALSVVRKPRSRIATLHGGGWIASGPPGADRLPRVAWPRELRMLPREQAGEVQTPVTGRDATSLRIGDRVWLRHTKAGELSEHVNTLHVIDGDRLVESIPTYRGEGKAFL
ncbi:MULTISPECIES: alanine racemase [unclassified Cryobacterium]|uniref:alanine racemase n=1 Tax=unclassified Cryobacterium TaxID=2649013 RepID=UPI001446658E|nr:MULTISPECIES: alanine racemase [unclassified Cryobacterium]